MIDFHSHCLPAMDDGARDREEALAMLAESVRQGVDTIVATPHFYRSQETIAEFLTRRAESFAQLADDIPQNLRLLLGAEVLIQKGLSREDLHPLCIEGTNRILIELPFMPFDPWIFEEMENIVLEQRLDVILAHVDRYIPWCSREAMRELMEFPEMVVQLNGECMLDRASFRDLRKWLPQTYNLVFGSDMHDMVHRPPNLLATYRSMKSKFRGREWLLAAQDLGPDLLLPLGESF